MLLGRPCTVVTKSPEAWVRASPFGGHRSPGLGPGGTAASQEKFFVFVTRSHHLCRAVANRQLYCCQGSGYRVVCTVSESTDPARLVKQTIRRCRFQSRHFSFIEDLFRNERVIHCVGVVVPYTMAVYNCITLLLLPRLECHYGVTEIAASR